MPSASDLNKLSNGKKESLNLEQNEANELMLLNCLKALEIYETDE